MKAKELMIGDLVIFEDNIHKITDLSLCIDGRAFVQVDGHDGYIFEHEISPIPLTEDILKTNGWKGTALYWSKHKVPFEISILICRTTPFINGHGSVCYYIKYVHELQHALRLCGLQKLADNFKIEL